MATFQSPSRPLPGAYAATPLAGRYGPPISLTPSGKNDPSQSLFAAPAQPGVNSQQAKQPTTTGPLVSSTNGAPPTGSTEAQQLSPVERAAKTVDEVLRREEQYPELEGYITQGISSDYDELENPGAAWAPFHKAATYPIPDVIFEQYNNAQMSTMMGLFGDVHHAWVSIDNAVYLWDYTHPNPELLGFEDQPSTITAVAMVKPRPGVFVPSVNRLLVVATINELVLIGVSAEKVAGGAFRLSLYQTKMSTSIRGLEVTEIAGTSDGRIFYGGTSDNDIYELTYQQEERWFYSRCSRIKHTSTRLMEYVPDFRFATSSGPIEHVTQIAVDDSRKLLYTLSSASTIRVFHMKPNNGLSLVITKTVKQTLSNIAHMTNQAPLIPNDTKLVGIHPITAQEASRLNLIVTTSLGCRIYMSSTTTYGYTIGAEPPSNMQVHHIKFPPPSRMLKGLENTHQGPPENSTTVTSYSQTPINTSSTCLKNVRTAVRYAPGSFFCLSATNQRYADTLFISAPDPGRIVKASQEPNTLSKFTEIAIIMPFDGSTEAIDLATAPFAAASTPRGFANELATQFDLPAADVLVLTNSGVTVFRRQRLVDILFTAAKTNEGPEGRDGSAKKLVRLYGRSETAATALAVACGEGVGAPSENSRAMMRDQDVAAFARKVFLEHGGKPTFNDNIVMDHGTPSIESVKPSPRHDGLALYISRILRSFWIKPIMLETVSPTGGLAVAPTVSLTHLADSQERLVHLKQFLAENKSFIDGLSGPETFRGAATKQDEVSMRAEHRALHALDTLVSHAIEGISFVQTLFKERIDEIVMTLANDIRQQVRSLTYQGLFCTKQGQELAKELVKSIVNRNIANGANVDTVADALRRQCGRFCSAEDVIVFKAQEQIRRSSDVGSNTEYGRNLLNESLRLYKKVAEALPFEQLHWAIDQFVAAQFYAGAIQLALDVANQHDRGNQALAWVQAGRPSGASNEHFFRQRKQCYDLVHDVINALDQAQGRMSDPGHPETITLRQRISEAYDVIDGSEDEVFHTDLYDWYLSGGHAERLLEIQSPFIVRYLTRRAAEELFIADLLCKYYLQVNKPHDAARTQLDLARGGFSLAIDKRIEYLSKAKSNASAYTSGISRGNKQKLLREITDLMDVASIQDDLLQKLKNDRRLDGNKQQRDQVLTQLGGPVLTLSELYNEFADSAGYYDICILIYQAADHRVPTDIRSTWRLLLESTHEEAVQSNQLQPYEAIADIVRTLGQRLNLSETTFPVPDLLPILKRYAFEQQRGNGSPTWVVDVFLDLGVPCDSLFAILEGMLHNDEAPFQGQNRKYIADDMVYVATRWFHDSSRGPGIVMGGEDNATSVLASLATAMNNGMSRERAEECAILRAKIYEISR